MQPIVTDVVTVHRVAESNTAGWPSTLFRVIHVGVEIIGLGAEGCDMRIPCWLPSVTLLSANVDPAFPPGGEWNGKAGSMPAVSMLRDWV